MPSRDVNAATRLAEASWRRNKDSKGTCWASGLILVIQGLIDGLHGSTESTHQFFCILPTLYKIHTH